MEMFLIDYLLRVCNIFRCFLVRVVDEAELTETKCSYSGLENFTFIFFSFVGMLTALQLSRVIHYRLFYSY